LIGMQMAQRRVPVSSRTLDVIRHTKRFLEAHQADRILLRDIARAVGLSPAYLTDIFRRCEGLPLHRYLTRLRLERARQELWHADDLTALALEVGFSSHSHFTAAFRKLFGCTPSQYRERMRARSCSRRGNIYGAVSGAEVASDDSHAV
jgi:AraC family transcriptional regulator